MALNTNGASTCTWTSFGREGGRGAVSGPLESLVPEEDVLEAAATDIEKKALNRPVTDLARTGDKEVIEYKNIKRPTLIIAGAKDPLREPGYAALLQKDIAGSELTIFEDAAHFPHIDFPDRFNTRVVEFLS